MIHLRRALPHDMRIRVIRETLQGQEIKASTDPAPRLGVLSSLRATVVPPEAGIEGWQTRRQAERLSHSPPWHAGWIRMSLPFFASTIWLAPEHRIRATRTEGLFCDVVIVGPLMPEVFQGEECPRVDLVCTMHGPDDVHARTGFYLEGQYRWVRDGVEEVQSWWIGSWPTIEAYRLWMDAGP